MNIPIYRAWCEKDSEYAVGFFISDDKENEILTRLDSGEMYARRIDITTLAIHFPDMIDSQGNKIFASLSEDGKGGDRIIEDGKYEDGFSPVFEPYFRKSSFSIYDLPMTRYGEYKLHQYKVIGIQE